MEELLELEGNSTGSRIHRLHASQITQSFSFNLQRRGHGLQLQQISQHHPKLPRTRGRGSERKKTSKCPGEGKPTRSLTLRLPKRAGGSPLTTVWLPPRQWPTVTSPTISTGNGQGPPQQGNRRCARQGIGVVHSQLLKETPSKHWNLEKNFIGEIPAVLVITSSPP